MVLAIAVMAGVLAAPLDGFRKPTHATEPPKQSLLGTAGRQLSWPGGPRPVGNAVGAGALHLLNRVMIATAQVAQERAHSKEVRAFAMSLAVSHAGYQRRLLAWLEQNEYARALLKDVDADTDASSLRIPAWLRQVAAARFERAFLLSSIGMAMRSLRFVEAALSTAQDRVLEQLLGEVALELRLHRATARGLLERAPAKPQ